MLIRFSILALVLSTAACVEAPADDGAPDLAARKAYTEQSLASSLVADAPGTPEVTERRTFCTGSGATCCSYDTDGDGNVTFLYCCGWTSNGVVCGGG
jgi:hypothetical protein